MTSSVTSCLLYHCYCFALRWSKTCQLYKSQLWTILAGTLYLSKDFNSMAGHCSNQVLFGLIIFL